MASEANMLRKLAGDLRVEAQKIEQRNNVKLAQILRASVGLKMLESKVRAHD